jgi:hypothetical protein
MFERIGGLVLLCALLKVGWIINHKALLALEAHPK